MKHWLGSALWSKPLSLHLSALLTMNLPHDHPIKESELTAANNPLGNARDPVIPFAWQQPATTNQKIQVEDQHLTPARNPVSKRIKHSIFIAAYGMSNVVLSEPFFALKHAFDFYQQVHNTAFLNACKCCKLLPTPCKVQLLQDGKWSLKPMCRLMCFNLHSSSCPMPTSSTS